MQAKAWDSLALFFEACAQIEIDDFRDYQKALQVIVTLHDLLQVLVRYMSGMGSTCYTSVLQEAD